MKLFITSALCFGGILIVLNFHVTRDEQIYLSSILDINRTNFTNSIDVQASQNFKTFTNLEGTPYNLEIKNSLEGYSGLKTNSSSLEVQPAEPFETPVNHEGTLNNVSQPLMTVLLLSSVGRSGSSFLGELLASQGNNIYLYEPIRALKPVQQTEVIIPNELGRYFRCHIPAILLDIGKNPYVSVRHPYTFGKKRSSVSVTVLEEICFQEPLRIIKTIRTRLRWMKKLLGDKDLNLKVIHLVRDPRGTSASMDELKWQMSTQDMCQRVGDDLKEREEIERLYPGRYFFIKYEDFCLDPYRKTSEIFRFLRGEKIQTSGTNNQLPFDTKPTTKITAQSFPDIPETVFRYLQSHVSVNIFSKNSPWTTARDSASHYQKWRYKISSQELLVVENHCQEVLNILGHKIFGVLQNVRNRSISLFTSG